ncbi:complement C5-like [Mya arenaria]|uniref:complement C5-like n=1 Tax=Mya arenaria TaxID=6604 RepID=UPI0022E4C8DC|nr:complement C5-like [Mya arenaria]
MVVVQLSLILCGVLIPACYAKDYWYAVTPNVFRLNHEETVVVGVLGNTENKNVQIKLLLGDVIIAQGQAYVKGQDNSDTITMKVTAENVIQYQELAGPKKKDQKPTHVTMVADFPDGSQSSREIVIGYKSGYLIVQTDKPLYTPREDVNVRVLAMDESLKPILDQNVYIDIRTPSSDVAGGAEVMTVDRKTFTGSKTGFYRHKFSLPPYPQIGEWTIRAYLPGKYDTETIVPFEVKEFVLPTFGVKITSSDEYILEDMEEVKVKIDATYVYGKKVQGSAGLQFSIVEDNGAKNEVFTKTRNDLINGLTEFTIDVGDLIDARGGGFPENARLLLEADVIEDATGKEEKSSEDFLVFTKSPFRFDLSRSKNTYRPGMSYYLKIDMTFVNGRTAAKQRIKIRYYEENEEKQMAKDEYITNDKGQLMEPVSTGNHQQQLHFHVHPIDYPGEATDFHVKPYNGNNQMVVEKVERDNAPFIRAYTNMNPVNQFTGIMMMIVSRGEIVYNKFNVPTNEINMRMENDIPQKISPGARLLAFYVDTNGDAIVADSTKFAVDPMCRGEPLTLKTEETTLDPGATGKLTVTGPSDMWVGFNIMDKALLLLNSDNILKHDTIFQALDSHDLGCGAGSGMNAEEIFKNAGLTILTNANADQAALRRTSEHCDKAKRRRRRSASPLKCHPKMHNCCEIGELLADGLLEWKDNQLDHRNIVVDLNPREDCMAKAMAIRRKKHITHECITSIYKFCLEKLASELRDQGLEGRSIFADDEQYKKDVNALIELGSFLTKRSNFETSFFFEEHQLSQGGPLKRSVKFRDSITEWSVQAIGLSATEGACIAESVDVKTFKKFFIQLDLPYKATRFERFNIKATVFNYNDQRQRASVYLKGADGLCYGTSPGKNSPRTLVELEPNSAKTLSFSVIPLVAGDIPVTVSAFVSSNTSGKADVIEKKLHVVNEGIMETKQIHVCLDPNNQMEACRNSPQVTANDPVHGDRPARTYNLDLALPKTALTGTGSATAYVESNIMDAVVATLLDGVDKMFTEPKYCGEQTMIMTAPIVYGMHYLKQTGQETAENEQQGTAWIKIGISREISEFQKIDGSYGAWQHWPTSLWLTAFVAKVFCQAEKVVDGVVVKESLQRTLNYIANNQKGTGYFVDNNPVIHKEMQGVLGQGDRKEDPSLTSFVLIALQECPERTEPVQDAVSNAQSYLEVLPAGNFQNKYLLAITTYALALSNSKHKGTFKNLLLEAVTERENMMYWSDHDGNEATAADVETTAYALLAFLKFDDIRTSGKIVTWLTGQRKAIGVWYTTQDTVVALQALAEYSVRTYNREVNLDIEIRNDQTLHKVSVTNDNALLQKVIPELLVKGTNNQFKVTVSGSGTARMNIELRWNRKALPNEKCYFDVSPIEINEVNPAFAGSSKDRFLIKDQPCNVCGRCPGDDIDNENEGIDYNDVDDAIHNRRKKREADVETPQKCVTFEVKTVDDDKSLMSIVKVNLETDVKAIEDDFKELMTNGVIDRYEMPEDGKSFVIFYINEISQVPRKFIFRLEDNFQGSTVSRQPATVVVYDYYKPEKKCIKPYGIGDNHGQEVGFRCDENNDQCECLQSQCSSPVDEELFDYTVKFSKLSRDKKAQTTKPTDMVANYACNLEKANFVYKVTIEETTFDAKVNMRYATAVIDSVILAGKENQNPDDEITLEWKLMCKHPDLKVGKTYYIVGKDPTIYNGDNNAKEPRYELMGTTLVIDPSFKPILRTVMNRFENQMADNQGCQD